MALSGTFYGTTGNDRIKPRIDWSAVQSVAGNYSDITATLSYSRTNTGYTTGGTWSGSITIGDQTFTGSKYIEITYNSNTVAITATARVYHDSYGRLNVKISASGAIAIASLSSTSISAAVTVDTIPRESTISAVNGDIESRSTIVIYRKNETFTHSVAYTFGKERGYIDADGNPTAQEVRLSATTINFLLPDTFYAQIPNAPTGICYLECKTYSGNTQIGQTQESSFTVTANEARCAPLVSGTVTDISETATALTGDPHKLIRFLSTARCVISAEPRKGASIGECRIGGVSVREGFRDIARVDTAEVVFQATDSRGYSGRFTVSFDLIPYVQLTNNATVQRTDPTSGNGVLTLQGNCWKGDFGAAENSLTARYRVGSADAVSVAVEIGDDHRYSLPIALSGLEYTQSHTVEVTVEDGAAEVSKTLTVQKGIPVFDWGGEDFRFNVPVELPGLTVKGQSLEAYIRSIVQGG